MPSFEHGKLVERVSRLNTVPEDATEYTTWIKASGHLELLRDNSQEDELAIYSSGEYSFVHTVVVDESAIMSLDPDDLLSWSGGPFPNRAGYAWGMDRDDVWIERDEYHMRSKSLEKARPLIFRRELDGLQGVDGVYFEVLQEYSHLTGIHWRPELKAHCNFDERGDWQQIVSITSENSDVTLISFRREQLEQYLATSNSVLIRMFDFTLLRYSEFTGWPDDPEAVVYESDDFFYRQKIDTGKAAYTRGVQIIRPAYPKRKIFSSIRDGRWPSRNREYCEFIVLDVRHEFIANISTHPSATTSYFQASENSLPFEVSPVFFRPEVLQKFKADRDKYTINEEHRFISCRGGWRLKTYDINEAGQVHTYVCYLRSLPYEEQLYWRSFNAEPQDGISERAYQNDIRGEPSDIVTPLVSILSIVRCWADIDQPWWQLTDRSLLERVNTPVSNSRDEWAQAFVDLAKLVIEGFRVRALRLRLEERGISFETDARSLVLIEKLLAAHANASGKTRLDGLRAVQYIRSKAGAHFGGSEAVELARNAIRDHGSYKAHFEAICGGVSDELHLIDEALRGDAA